MGALDFPARFKNLWLQVATAACGSVPTFGFSVEQIRYPLQAYFFVPRGLVRTYTGGKKGHLAPHGVPRDLSLNDFAAKGPPTMYHNHKYWVGVKR